MPTYGAKQTAYCWEGLCSKTGFLVICSITIVKEIWMRFSYFGKRTWKLRFHFISLLKLPNEWWMKFISNIFLTYPPPSFLHHISQPFLFVHTCLCTVLFLQGHIQPGWHTTSSCLLTCITVLLLLLAKVVDKYQINMDLKCHFIMKTVIFVSIVLNLQPFSDETLPASSVLALSVKVKKMWHNRKEKQCRRAWRRSLSLCSTWYFLHFKTLELYCCQHDG